MLVLIEPESVQTDLAKGTIILFVYAAELSLPAIDLKTD